MKKKLWNYLLVTGLCLSTLCGCSSQSTTSATSDTEVSSTVDVNTETAAQKNSYTQTSSMEKEAVSVSISDRKEFLFDNGFPKKKKQMKQYLTAVALPAIDSKGREINVVMQVHKKLADNFRGAFQELKEKGYLFQGDQIFIYSWRKALSGERSSHSYGCAVDLLLDKYKEADRKKIKEIMKEHGLSYISPGKIQEREEYLHFSYINF